jgi:hypothetical protein
MNKTDVVLKLTNLEAWTLYHAALNSIMDPKDAKAVFNGNGKKAAAAQRAVDKLSQAICEKSRIGT